MQTSAISIRPADPVSDRDRILAVLGRNLPTAAFAERHQWLYLDNPVGPALVWLAEDEAGDAVGTSAAHPRRMRIDGEVVTALNLSDFAFDQGYRTLGPALQLLKATLEPVRRGDYLFSYDYPSRSMAAIYHRMGGADLGPNERWVRPATMKAIGKRKLGVVGAVVGAAGDVALRTRDRLARGADDVAVALHDGTCGGEFDALDARLAQLGRVMGVRDAAYLNWRYGSHAMWRHEIICARRAGALVGFAVVRSEEPGAATLVDLFAVDEEDVRRRLVTTAVDWARARDAESLQVEVLQGGATARMVEQLGFIRREEGAGPVPFVPADRACAATLHASESWWAMGGDRDI